MHQRYVARSPMGPDGSSAHLSRTRLPPPPSPGLAPSPGSHSSYGQQIQMSQQQGRGSMTHSPSPLGSPQGSMGMGSGGVSPMRRPSGGSIAGSPASAERPENPPTPRTPHTPYNPPHTPQGGDQGEQVQQQQIPLQQQIQHQLMMQMQQQQQQQQNMQNMQHNAQQAQNMQQQQQQMQQNAQQAQGSQQQQNVQHQPQQRDQAAQHGQNAQQQPSPQMQQPHARQQAEAAEGGGGNGGGGEQRGGGGGGGGNAANVIPFIPPFGRFGYFKLGLRGGSPMWSPSYRKEVPRPSANPASSESSPPTTNVNSPATTTSASENLTSLSSAASSDLVKDNNSQVSEELNVSDIPVPITSPEVTLPVDSVLEVSSEGCEKSEKVESFSSHETRVVNNEEHLAGKDGSDREKSEIEVDSRVDSVSSSVLDPHRSSKESLDDAGVIIVDDDHKVVETYDMKSDLPHPDLDGVVSVINETSTDPYISGDVENEEVICIPEESVMVAANVSVETMDGSTTPTVVHSPGSLQVVSSSVEFEECVETSVVVVVGGEDDDEEDGVRDMLETVEVTEEEVGSVGAIEMLVGDVDTHIEECETGEEESKDLLTAGERESKVMLQSSTDEPSGKGDEKDSSPTEAKKHKFAAQSLRDITVPTSQIMEISMKDKLEKKFPLSENISDGLHLFEVNDDLDAVLPIEDDKQLSNLESQSKPESPTEQMILYKEGVKSDLLISGELNTDSESGGNFASVQSLHELQSPTDKLTSGFADPMIGEACKSSSDDVDSSSTIETETNELKHSDIMRTSRVKRTSEQKKAEFDDSQSIDALEAKLEASPESPLHEERTLTVLHSLNQDDTIELPPDVFNIQMGKISVLEDDEICDRDSSVRVGNIFSDVLDTDVSLEQEMGKTNDSKEISDKENISLGSDDLKVPVSNAGGIKHGASESDLSNKQELHDSLSKSITKQKEERSSSISFIGDPPKIQERDSYDSDFDRFLDKDFKASKEIAREASKELSAAKDKTTNVSGDYSKMKGNSPSVSKSEEKASTSLHEMKGNDGKVEESCTREPFSIFTQDLRVSQIPLLMNESQLKTFSEIFDISHDEEPMKSTTDREKDKGNELSAFRSQLCLSSSSSYSGNNTHSGTRQIFDSKEKDLNKVDEVAQIELWLSQARSEADKESSAAINLQSNNSKKSETVYIKDNSISQADICSGSSSVKIKPEVVSVDAKSDLVETSAAAKKEIKLDSRKSEESENHASGKGFPAISTAETSKHSVETMTLKGKVNLKTELVKVSNAEIKTEEPKYVSMTPSTIAVNESKDKSVTIPSLPPTSELPPSSVHQANIGIPRSNRPSHVTYSTLSESSLLQSSSKTTTMNILSSPSTVPSLSATAVATIAADAVSAARLPYPPAKTQVLVPSSSTIVTSGDSKLVVSVGVATVGSTPLSTPYTTGIGQSQFPLLFTKGLNVKKKDGDGGFTQLATSTTKSAVGVVSSTTVSLGTRMSVGDISQSSIQGISYIPRVSQVGLPMVSTSSVGVQSVVQMPVQIQSGNQSNKEQIRDQPSSSSQNISVPKSEVSFSSGQISLPVSSVANSTTAHSVISNTNKPFLMVTHSTPFSSDSQLLKQTLSNTSRQEIHEISTIKKEPVDSEVPHTSTVGIQSFIPLPPTKGRTVPTTSISEVIKEEKEEEKKHTSVTTTYPQPPPPRTDSQNVLLKQLLQNTACAGQHQLVSGGLGSIGTSPSISKQPMQLLQSSSVGSSRSSASTSSASSSSSSSSGPLLPVVPSLEAQLARPVPPTPTSLLPPILLADGPPRTSTPPSTISQRPPMQSIPRGPTTTSAGFAARHGTRPPGPMPSTSLTLNLHERRLPISTAHLAHRESQPIIGQPPVATTQSQTMPKKEEEVSTKPTIATIPADAIKIEVEEGNIHQTQHQHRPPSIVHHHQQQEQPQLREEQQMLRQQQIQSIQQQQQENLQKQLQQKQIQLAHQQQHQQKLQQQQVVTQQVQPAIRQVAMNQLPRPQSPAQVTKQLLQPQQQPHIQQVTQPSQLIQVQQQVRLANQQLAQAVQSQEPASETSEERRQSLIPDTERKESVKVEAKTEEMEISDPNADKTVSDPSGLDPKKAKRRQYQQKRRQSVGKEGSVPKKRARKASSNSEVGSQQGGSKIEEDHDSFVDGVMSLLRSTLPPLAVTEPELGRNMAVCPIFGSGDLTRLGKRGYNNRTGELTGSYGKASISGVADHYDTRPFGPQSPLPILPQSSQQRGFYDQEFAAIKFDGDDDRKDGSGRGGSRDRDTNTPDTIISSSSPECVVSELPIRFP
ncbi:hypothetical protein J437_LFUL019640, partial [Ladona fulva]